MENKELKEITFRVNAIYENKFNDNKTGQEKFVIKILGYIKDMQTEEKTDVTMTIWPKKQNGDDTFAYHKFLEYDINKGDLIFSKCEDNGEYNGKKQYTIKSITNVIKSKFDPNEKKVEEVEIIPHRNLIDDNITPPNNVNAIEVPWEEDIDGELSNDTNKPFDNFDWSSVEL